MTTIADVARIAGVSKNTVSRYLNNRGYISQKTQESIQEAIDLLHYQPNQIARGLFTGRTNLVGLVIPDVIQPFFATMAFQIEDELDRRGYKMILCNTMYSQDKERRYLDMLRANKADGIIIGSHSTDIDYSGIDAPVVALDRNLSDTIPVVHADHEHGGRAAAQAFIEHDRHNVIQLMGYSRVRTPSIRRHQVFADQLARHAIPCATIELEHNQFEFDTYLNVADKLLDEHPDVDGVFASDLVALAIQRQALARGIAVPDDLFVFGYDGSFIYKTCWPPLPTIIQPYEKLASAIVDILIRRIEGDCHIPMDLTIDVDVAYESVDMDGGRRQR